ncbi:MAG TPA: OmpA family protein [Bryobacteraceae bacterium]|nr:OmpA family protein [Bryobacteraceae bacterium]
MFPNRRFLSPALLMLTPLLMVFASACSKKTPVVPPPSSPQAQGNTSAPAAGRPVISEFIAEPSSVERGQSAILRWTVSGATGVAIDHGIGTVPLTGTQRLAAATATTTYTLTATGPGGEATSTATLTVTSPTPRETLPPPVSTTGTLDQRVERDLQDALFDYDSNNIRGDARTTLSADAEALKRIFADFPRATIIVEGHCDERGSAEYNLGLGDRRATAARDFLTQLGVSADRLKTVSYGKERPTCTEATESCWQRNRRAHFSVGQ